MREFLGRGGGWFILAALLCIGAVPQLCWSPARFGGIFFLLLAACCTAEGLLVRFRAKNRAFLWLSRIGRLTFWIFALSFVYVQTMVIGFGGVAQNKSVQADYLFVLGARVNPNGQPSAALAARCDTAIDYLSQYPACIAIVCGGQGETEPCAEAYAMRDYMVGKGAAESRILTEPSSMNTIENIANAKSMLPKSQDGSLPTCAVVTSDYHLARARRLLEKAGLGNLGLAAPVPYPAQWVSVRCREYGSIIGLWLSGRW